MPAISMQEFEKWLDAYGAAWQDGDAEAATDLFADEAEYYETPFDDPMIGRDTIHRYCAGAGDSQKDVRFLHESMAVVDSKGFARWQATFVRIPSGNHIELDGFLMAQFDGTGKCSVFREWWHRRETESSLDSS